MFFKKKDPPDENLQLFSEYLPQILQKADGIIGEREFRYTLIADSAYLHAGVVGGGYLPLGTLLSFWQKNEFTDECHKCGGKVYLFCARGSPLSGGGSMEGVCIDCKRRQKTAFKASTAIALHDHHLFKPFQKLVKPGFFPRFAQLVEWLRESEV